jgi:hypothetical protein
MPHEKAVQDLVLDLTFLQVDPRCLLAEARRKNSAAAILAAGKTFRSRTFSTSTGDYTH